jgi:hypothetical protein
MNKIQMWERFSSDSVTERLGQVKARLHRQTAQAGSPATLCLRSQQLSPTLLDNFGGFKMKCTRQIRACLAGIIVALSAGGAPAQVLPSPANASFVPKATYGVGFDKAWGAVIAAINANSIQIASTVKDAGQINTEYMAGPTEEGSFFTGPLVSRYKFAVTVIPVTKGQTQFNVKPTLQARRLAGSAGKIMSGNNALSDVEWIDATAANPNEIEGMRKWFYEQIERTLQ